MYYRPLLISYRPLWRVSPIDIITSRMPIPYMIHTYDYYIVNHPAPLTSIYDTQRPISPSRHHYRYRPDPDFNDRLQSPTSSLQVSTCVPPMTHSLPPDIIITTPIQTTYDHSISITGTERALTVMLVHTHLHANTLTHTHTLHTTTHTAAHRHTTPHTAAHRHTTPHTATHRHTTPHTQTHTNNHNTLTHTNK